MLKSSLRDIDNKYWKEYWHIKAKYFPLIKNCQEQYEDFVEHYLETDTFWLDAGCGHILLHHWNEEKPHRFVNTAKTVVGVDGDLDGLRKNQVVPYRVAGNLEVLPFRSGSFTLLTCNMVIEHIMNPTLFVEEICRVLKPGGVAIIHTPNIFHYETLIAYLTPHIFHEIYCRIMEDREPSDVFPVFYRANHLSKLKQLFDTVGMPLERGGIIVDAPKRFPIPVLHKALLFLSILETKVLFSEFFAPFRNNLLVAFRKRNPLS
jgi:ubiquinone/menaquinone biosynthesis C-methylase UbiE